MQRYMRENIIPKVLYLEYYDISETYDYKHQIIELRPRPIVLE